MEVGRIITEMRLNEVSFVDGLPEIGFTVFKSLPLRERRNDGKFCTDANLDTDLECWHTDTEME